MIKKALFIGLTTVDIQYFVDQHPEENKKIKTDEPLVVAGGPAANAALTYAYMGGQVDFLSCIGENSFSKILYDDLKRKCSLSIIDAKKGEEYNPIIATILTSKNGSRTIVTHHPQKIDSYTFDVNLNNYDLVFTDGFYPEIAIPICKEANQLKIPVVFDGGSWKTHLTNLLEYVDYAICSADFIPPNCKTITDIFTFLQGYGIQYNAISKGEMSIETEGKSIPIEHVRAYDTLGAGDILHGAFCWYLTNKNFQFHKALTKASKIATESVKHKGTRSWMDYSNNL